MTTNRSKYDDAKREICDRYAAEFTPIDWGLRVAIADDFFGDALPKNGVRIEVEGNMTGWYLYASDTISEAVDYYKPYCAEHLPDILPSVIPYLGLPVGWRFIFAPGYEDVWCVES